MTSGAKKLWINPIHRSRPTAVLCRARLGFDKMQGNKFLSTALAGCIAEAVSLEASIFAVACLKAFVRMPEPAIFISMPVGEMAEHQEEVTLRMREGLLQFLVIEYGMWRKEKV